MQSVQLHAIFARMGQLNITLRSANPDATAAFAEALGAQLRAGDTVLLSGGIGAGKTHLARALIQSVLPQPEDVPSPTFTLVQVYDGPTCEIWHADLYRLTDSSELVELGLTDAFDEAICIIEWPDRLGELAPQNALTISLSLTDAEEARLIHLSGDDARWGFLSQLDTAA